MVILLNQVTQFLHQYQLPIAISAFVIALLLLTILIYSRRQQSQSPQLSKAEIEMLAGDNIITTQLDLARAYLEMGKNHLAKSLLIQIIKRGNSDQKIIARQLMGAL